MRPGRTIAEPSVFSGFPTLTHLSHRPLYVRSRKFYLQSRVDELRPIQREPQRMSLVVGKKLRIEYFEINPILVGPVLRNTVIVHVDRPTIRGCRRDGLETDFDQIGNVRKRLVVVAGTQMGDGRAVGIRRLGGNNLDCDIRLVADQTPWRRTGCCRSPRQVRRVAAAAGETSALRSWRSRTRRRD